MNSLSDEPRPGHVRFVKRLGLPGLILLALGAALLRLTYQALRKFRRN